MTWNTLLLPLLLLVLPSVPDAIPILEANDNSRPAGTLRADTLTLRLEVREARWFPEAADGPSVVVAAFAEAGQVPSIPGPLIRVREGTTLDIAVTNHLTDSTLRVHGLVMRPAVVPGADSLIVPPGQTRRVSFVAGAPGTYFYWADAGAKDTLLEREQLAGAFVVDPAGGSPPDRVFVINIWGNPVRDSAGKETGYHNALAINGKSWPHTERFDYAVGDSVRWRWINASGRNHPMHLHGFYFRAVTHGSAFTDTVIAAERQHLAVTDGLFRGRTMTMEWSPNRQGNWLFHCHITFHVVAEANLPRTAGDDAHPAHDPVNHMAALVLGMRVRDPAGESVRREPTQRLRLLARQVPGRDDSHPVMTFQLDRRDPLRGPGPVLMLTRGEPTAITVVNEMPEPTAVHWHGLELESWSDGVAGWSGWGGTVAPPIAPRDSFVAHLTLPRAGTFIYHTHLNDLRQLTSGLYGGLVVLEPGAPFDPATDHVFVLGWDGDAEPPTFLPHFVLNGDSTPAPLTFVAGRTHRLRFINIGPAAQPPFTLWRDTTQVRWRPLAKDGADLPVSQSVEGPARVRINVGETSDVLFTPPGSGSYELRVGPPARPFIVQRIVVP